MILDTNPVHTYHIAKKKDTNKNLMYFWKLSKEKSLDCGFYWNTEHYYTYLHNKGKSFDCGITKTYTEYQNWNSKSIKLQLNCMDSNRSVESAC